jgi:hypothetical protein
MSDDINRLNEWFVPKFGPIKFRIAVGILFLPYTAMCISFTILGALLAPYMHWDRLIAMVIIYFFALGIGAHFADNLGSRKRPWGKNFGTNTSWRILIFSLAVAYGIGIYYIIFFVPLLSVIAILEGFLLFAYNFEKFKGYFHTDFWFVIAWGAVPVFAGYVMQTNSIAPIPILAAVIAGFISYVEISLSRPYKILRRHNEDNVAVQELEKDLKIISLGTLAIVMISLTLRIFLA